MKKGMLWAGVATIALQAAATPATAQTATSGTSGTATLSPVKPVYGNIRAFYGNIRAFWGDVNPFYGNIRAFWGDVNPFYGNIRAFWGNVDPILTSQTAGAPGFATIAPFWETAGAQWNGISANWQTAGSFEENRALYGTIGTQLNTLVDTSAVTWGAAVTAKTGKSFRDGFANPLFARFNVSPNDPASLAGLSPAEQSHLFIDWYDGLMEFSGTDHADHWMKAINWTPKLTQVQGGGSDAVIGLVDFFVAGDADIKSKVIYQGGVSTYTNGHGAGVGSLIVASHDGKGIMGIAPKAKVATFNPFDTTGSADWKSVIKGIEEVTKRSAAVVNLSLGVPGSTLSGDWRGVFASEAVKPVKDRTIYVIAAGNDGVTQAQNINMKDAFDSTFLVVGSVDPSGNISEFSNRPGTACLLDGADCKDDPKKPIAEQMKTSSLLMRRFIVAPGELILVSDGAGGVTRQSGTSLAAPLVTGAIALIHDRWPWLKNHPRGVAQMILGSAKDLGAPGVDPVYGAGMLDVEAAQSPLSFDALKIYMVLNGKTTEQRPQVVQDTGVKTTWEAQGAFFTAFEKVEGAERDFLIPLSSRLVGTSVNGQYFQDYLYDRMTTWMNGASFAPTSHALGFAGHGQAVAATGNDWSFSMSARLANPHLAISGGRRARMNSTFYAQGPQSRLGFAVGFGDGAAAIGGNGFNMASDYDPQVGGANPLLGFASGGSHMAVTTGAGEKLQISMGMTENRRDRWADSQNYRSLTNPGRLPGLDTYRARAMNVRVDYQPVEAVTLTMSATQLDEPNALLGVRSVQPSDFDAGGTTSGITVGTNLAFGNGYSLAASATGSRTRSDGGAAALRVGKGGLLGTAFQFAVGKSGLFNRGDSLRISVAQPLSVERGSIEFTNLQVVNRETGEIGPVTQSFDIAGRGRRFVAEATYGVPVLQGRATLSAFGRGELADVNANTPRLMLGSQVSLGF